MHHAVKKVDVRVQTKSSHHQPLKGTWTLPNAISSKKRSELLLRSSSRSFQKFQGSQIAALLYRYKSLSKWRQSIQTLQRRLADFKRGIIDTESISPTIIVLVIKIKDIYMLRIIKYKNVLQTIEFDKKVLKISDG
jgi:hypothetical protein